MLTKKIHLRTIVLLLPILMLCALQIFPIYVVILTSFKIPIALLDDGQALAWNQLYLGNYKQVLFEDNFLYHVWSSLKITCLATLFSVFLASMASFALTHYRFKIKKTIIFTILCSRMIPPISIAIPLFLLINFLDIHDTLWGITIAHISFILPFCIWLLLPFYDSIPKELGEAAKIDGLSAWQIYFSIYLPISSPGIIISTIFSFLFSWNDFLYSLILGGSNTKTAPLAINAYMTSEQIEWGAMSASSVIIMVPIFLLSMILQKNILQGNTYAGIKG